ncbi:lysozyme inhibitor LprI family protein [Candidimonas nitroreducens]|uniref:Lysozyme inhibitor LprI-like N-terminal domain-containing protein n=1 Tax=Candidimonas nitroreducens TaxID=683354 RepID=A0A225MLQ9_9BURK|nr:lysozyme inhibitor LprI family protein [Candidimonas nitroreducens]OWT61902.1 hypothetical protein CEY11_08735 [Candidimonas nitroreducens]
MTRTIQQRPPRRAKRPRGATTTAAVPARLWACVLACGIAGAMPAPAQSASAGFDCTKATRQIDKAICGWDTVAALDGRMTAAYKTALAAQHGEAAVAAARQSQREWLARRDRRCALNKVTPREGSEEGLSPRQFGQLMCLQTAYPARIAQLMDIAAAPLVPRKVETVPVEPLQAAYPDDWSQAGYQAQFSPDKTLMALGVEDGAGYIKQVWLYQPASGRLVAASPRTHVSRPAQRGDISDLNTWIWGRDGRLYIQAKHPLGPGSLFAADMQGYAELRDPPPDVARHLANLDAARSRAPAPGTPPQEKQPPGFDDDSYDEQQGGNFTAWAQNKGHGSFDLMAAGAGDTAPRLIASGGWELRAFLFDPSGTRLFYNGTDGLVVTDPATGTTRRLQGTRGTTSEVRPINMSADGAILVYSASGGCTRDAAHEIDLDADDDDGKRVCVAYLPAVAGAAATAPALAAPAAEEGSAHADRWLGKWQGSGEGALRADIHRDTAKPGHLAVDLYTSAPGCSGAVTLYGQPQGAKLQGTSHDPDQPAAPACTIEFSLDHAGALKSEVAGPCSYYHGASCGFDGSMTRSK